MRRFLQNHAAATLEYVMLIVIILGAAIVSRDYISRAIFGKWKTSMDSLSSGRQYDPQKTLECLYDSATGIWYDVKCAEAIVCAPTDTPCLFDRINQCSPKCIDNEHPPICSRRTQCDRTPPPECGEVPDNCDGPPLQCGDCPNSGDRCNPDSHRCECNPKTTCEPGDCGDGVSDNCGGTITCPDLCSPGICIGNRCCTPQPACNAGQCEDIDAGCGVTLHCGNTCSSNQVCFNNACCPLPTCQPGQCGDIPNAGCGVTLHCGDPCTSLGLSCNAATHQCECILKTCGAEQCGEVSDGCRGTLNCSDPDPCPPLGKVCFEHQCCQPAACDGQCEEIDAGCGVTLQCPSCPSPQRCITEFNRNRCCTPLTCTPGRCGVSGDNCQGTLDCGFPCSPLEVCSIAVLQLGIFGNQCCTPDDAIICSRAGVQCGPASGIDNCGWQRTVAECGPCIAPEVCSIAVPERGILGQQCCFPEGDAAICSRLNRQCGPVNEEEQITDNCGHVRTITECGPCPFPQQVCSIPDQQCCVPESDTDLCSRLNRECGPVNEEEQITDNCGHVRTVAECGPCSSPQVCSIGVPELGITGQQCCFPVPESDEEMCSRLGIECGSTSGTDNCGWPRPIDCGLCSEDSSNQD